MKLLKQTTELTRLETYWFYHEKEGAIVYKEWFDPTGKVMDWQLEGQYGQTMYEEDHPAILKQIWEHVDQLEQQKQK